MMTPAENARESCLHFCTLYSFLISSSYFVVVTAGNKMGKRKREKHKKYFPFTFDELWEKYAMEENVSNCGISFERDFKCCLRLSYAFLPTNTSEFGERVKEALDNLVLTYNHETKKMMLCYDNVRMQTPIRAGISRSLFVHCVVDVFLFQPFEGNTLTGIVNKKSDHHIGCIVYDAFNVSIVKPHNEDYKQWAGCNVQVGNQITFKVIKVDLTDSVPYIRAELISVELQYSDRSDGVIDNTIIKEERPCVKKVSKRKLEKNDYEGITIKKSKKGESCEIKIETGNSADTNFSEIKSKKKKKESVEKFENS